MRATAAYLVGRRQIQIRTVDLSPREDEVLIAVKACGIRHGDLQILDREQPGPKRFGHKPVGRVVA